MKIKKQYWRIIFLLALTLTAVVMDGCLPPFKAEHISKDVIVSPQYNEESENTIKRYYDWQYKGKTFKISLTVKESFYEYFKTKRRLITPDPSVYSIYVTHPLDDHDMKVVADTLKYIAVSEGYSTKETAELIISFVRSLPWISDIDSTGFVENPKFPIETLIDKTGDCEDSTFLLSTLLNAVGFHTVLLATKNHIAVGISVTPDKFPYFEYDGRKYYYIESTKSNFAIGQIPKFVDPAEIIIIPLKPRPLLSQSIEFKHSEGITVIELLTNNVGSAPVDHIRVTVSIKVDDYLIYEQSSDDFSLPIDNNARVLFNLKLRSKGESPPIFVTTQTWYSYNSDNYSASVTREFATNLVDN